MSELSPIMHVAVRARRDALSIGTTMAALSSSNSGTVVGEVNAHGVGEVFNSIQIALTERLCMVVARAFTPHWPNDLHLRSGFRLLADGETEGVGSDQQIAALEALRPRFDAAAGDRRCERISHYRHKFLAHYGRADPAKKLPEMRDLYEFAELTAELMDDFAHAAGVLGPRFRLTQAVDARDAAAFWGRWDAQGAV